MHKEFFFFFVCVSLASVTLEMYSILGSICITAAFCKANIFVSNVIV